MQSKQSLASGKIGESLPCSLPSLKVAGSYQQNASNYGVAKFLQIQHAAELAKREEGNGVEAGQL